MLTMADLAQMDCTTAGTADTHSVATLQARYDALDSYAGRGADPRCGCDAPDACYWDSTADLEEAMTALEDDDSQAQAHWDDMHDTMADADSDLA